MSKNKFDKNCEDRCFDTDIFTLKILDQCRQKECITIGPLVSDEKCDCIIPAPGSNFKNFGSLVLPGYPIKVPVEAVYAKVLDDSFRLKKVDISDVQPSRIKKCYWSAQITYVFECNLQFLDIVLKPLKVICCNAGHFHIDKNRLEKDFIKAQINYNFQVILYGGDQTNSQIFSDVFNEHQSSHYNTPHFIIDISAYPLEFSLKEPCCKEQCNEVLNDPYQEPFKYVFVTIGISAIIRLVKFESMAINSIDSKNPPLCKFNLDPCETFSEMEFPDDLFFEDKDLS